MSCRARGHVPCPLLTQDRGRTERRARADIAPLASLQYLFSMAGALAGRRGSRVGRAAASRSARARRTGERRQPRAPGRAAGHAARGRRRPGRGPAGGAAGRGGLVGGQMGCRGGARLGGQRGRAPLAAARRGAHGAAGARPTVPFLAPAPAHARPALLLSPFGSLTRCLVKFRCILQPGHANCPKHDPRKMEQTRCASGQPHADRAARRSGALGRALAAQK
jgi:hypothetical protein